MDQSDTTIRRHHLPHLRRDGACYFVSFTTRGLFLPPPAREMVLEAIRHFEGARYDLLAAVVMHNHVHMLVTPLAQAEDRRYELSDILKGLKGFTARKINVFMGRTGALWNSESYDRIVRDANELHSKMEYIRNNAVKAGLVRYAEEYPYYYARELVEQ